MFLGMAGPQSTAYVARDAVSSDQQHATLMRQKSTECDAHKALLAAQDSLQQHEHSQAAHVACVAALLDLLAFQLKKAEAAYSRAVPDASAVAAVHETRARLEQSLTAVWDMVGWKCTTTAAAPGAVTFDSLYSEPSIQGAMQFCRFFASPAGLAVMHRAAGMQQNQQQEQEQQQRHRQRPPFTLVVDPKGTGHAFTLQSALDMAAAAAAQHAQQQYSADSTSSYLADSSRSSKSSSRCMDQSPAKHSISGHVDQSPVKRSNSSSKTRAATSSSGTSTRLDQSPAKHTNCSSSSSSTTKACSGTDSSRRASDEVLVVLLPGTYLGCCTLPAAIKHITISGIRGSKTMLCQQQQKQLPLDMSLGQLQLQPAVASLAGAAALITCPAGVALSLQHLQLQMAQVYDADNAARSQCVLLQHGSAPAGISHCSFSFVATRSSSNSNNGQSGGDSRSSSSSNFSNGYGSNAMYCIRACGSCQVRLEACIFAGCTGGVLAEAGAAVTVQQCSFRDSCSSSSRYVVVHEFEMLDAAGSDGHK